MILIAWVYHLCSLELTTPAIVVREYSRVGRISRRGT